MPYPWPWIQYHIIKRGDGHPLIILPRDLTWAFEDGRLAETIEELLEKHEFVGLDICHTWFAVGDFLRLRDICASAQERGKVVYILDETKSLTTYKKYQPELAKILIIGYPAAQEWHRVYHERAAARRLQRILWDPHYEDKLAKRLDELTEASRQRQSTQQSP